MVTLRLDDGDYPIKHLIQSNVSTKSLRTYQILRFNLSRILTHKIFVLAPANDRIFTTKCTSCNTDKTVDDLADTASSTHNVRHASVSSTVSSTCELSTLRRRRRLKLRCDGYVSRRSVIVVYRSSC